MSRVIKFTSRVERVVRRKRCLAPAGEYRNAIKRDPLQRQGRDDLAISACRGRGQVLKNPGVAKAPANECGTRGGCLPPGLRPSPEDIYKAKTRREIVSGTPPKGRTGSDKPKLSSLAAIGVPACTAFTVSPIQVNEPLPVFALQISGLMYQTHQAGVSDD